MRDIKVLFENNSWQELFFKFATYFFVGTLPLFLNLNTIALWLFIVSTIFTFKSHNGINNLRANIVILISIFSLFFLFALGLFLSKDVYRVLKDIMRVIPLFLIPLAIIVHGKENFNIKYIYNTLGIGLFIGMLICWYNILISIMSRQDYLKQASYFFEWVYTDWNLVKPLDGHPSYFAVLLVLFLSAIIFSKYYEDLRKNRVKFLLLMIPFFLFLIETSSRIGIIIFISIFFVYVLKRMNLKLLLSFLLLLLAIVFFSIKFDYLGTKFKKTIGLKGGMNIERIDRWKEILDVFSEKESFLFGVGSGDARLVYRRAYYNGGFDLALKENYNAHNQYLEFFVSNGIIGLIFYFLFFVFFYKFTNLQEATLHIFICFVLFSMSESFLGRSQGVMMFSFFYAISTLKTQKEL